MGWRHNKCKFLPHITCPLYLSVIFWKENSHNREMYNVPAWDSSAVRGVTVTIILMKTQLCLDSAYNTPSTEQDLQESTTPMSTLPIPITAVTIYSKGLRCWIIQHFLSRSLPKFQEPLTLQRQQLEAQTQQQGTHLVPQDLHSYSPTWNEEEMTCPESIPRWNPGRSGAVSNIDCLPTACASTPCN